MEIFSPRSPPLFTNSEWTDSSKEDFVTEAAVETLSYSTEEIGDSVQPTLQSSVLRITSTKTEEAKDNNGTAEAATPRDGWSARSTISIELTLLTDIMNAESTIKNDPTSETTQSYHTITQQGQDIARDSTPTHADVVFVSEQQSRDTDELVTLSSMSDVTSRLDLGVSEKLTQSSNTTTSIDSTSKAIGLTSDDSNLLMNSATVAVDGVRSSADHSQLRLNDASSAGVTFFGRFSLDSTTTAYTRAIAHESSEADNKTSSTQVPSDDDAVSTQYNSHTFISTSTLDGEISEHAVSSTDAQEDPVLIGTFSPYAWKTREAENTFQSGSTSSAERLSLSSEKPPEGPGTSAVTGYAIGATAAGLVLIAILCVVVIIYRRRRRKSCDLADQDLKDYRSLMKIPSRSQTNDGFTAPCGAFQYSPFAELTTEDGSNSSFSATNFRARFDHEPNGTSTTQKNGSESEKEIPLQELSEPPSAAGYSEAFSVDTFRPSRQHTADTQLEATNVV